MDGLISRKLLGRILIIGLLASLGLASPSLFHAAQAQSGVSVMYVSPISVLPVPAINSTFQVSVGLNLSSSDGISGYDVLLRSDFFNDSYVGQVLKPLSIQAGNVFQGRDNLTLANCVNNIGSGCDPTKGDGFGAVHSAMTVLGDPVPGGQSVTLFSATFKVVGTGVTLLQIVNDNVTYDPPVPGYGPNNLIIMHSTYDGIFSNNGLAPFFNVASPAIHLPGVPVIFDASASFSSSGSPVTGYSWDFGDGVKNITTIPRISHLFDKAGGYRVALNATAGSLTREIVRIVTVSSSLGALKIFPVPVPPSNASYQGSITVSLFNLTGSSASLIGTRIKPPQSSWVLFSGLKAGDYRADFSGDGVTGFSKSESVTAGWTTWDTVYIPVTVSIPPTQTDYALSLFLGVVGIGVSLAAAGLLLRRRSERKQARKVRTKTRKGSRLS